MQFQRGFHPPGAMVPAYMVSILTRPEGRMQSVPGCNANPMTVSILTRPEGRMQYPRRCGSHLLSHELFQSSPGQKAGCNRLPVGVPFSFNWRSVPSFNPHPARRPDAILAGILGVANLPGCFNPHPARRPDAISVTGDGASWPVHRVSILTRPEGRMQWLKCQDMALHPLVCFNPHPARRPDAIVAVGELCRIRCFNPHPARRPDAIANECCLALLEVRVSILTRPEGRMQCRRGNRPSQARLTVLGFQSSPGQKAGCNPMNVP